MTLHHLRVFIKVAECGSVSAAARECHLAQPTVSQLIKELEDFYAARLFERLSKRLYITEEGRRLLSRAKEVAGAYERLEYDMSPDKRRDRLCIGSSVTVGMCLMPSLVKRFGAARPETEIYSYVNNTQTIERMLLGSELDAAVVLRDALAVRKRRRPLVAALSGYDQLRHPHALLRVRRPRTRRSSRSRSRRSGTCIRAAT